METQFNNSRNVEDSTSARLTQNPCYVQPFSEVFNEDCIQVMKRYPDKFFDLAVVDPPYGLKIANSEYLGNDKNDKRWNGRANGYRHIKKNWDNEVPSAEYFIELQRVSKNQIVWGWNYYVSYFNDCPSYIVWNKEASGNYSDCEMAWCSIKGTNKIFKWLWNGFRKQQPEARIHPTQKPVALYDWIYSKFAVEGQKILDTHLGSGSSRISANKAKLNFVGCEIDEEYFNKQNKRHEEFVSQIRLF